MNLGAILKKVGGAIISSVVPGGGLIIDLVNGFLPNDKKLDKSATGSAIEKAIGSLTPEQQSSLLSKELDVEITSIKEWSNVIGSLAEVDKIGQSTRPGIAKAMSWAIIFGVVITLGPIAYAIVTGDSEMIDSISKAWPLIATAIGIPAGVVNSYFGKRTKEKKARYTTASGLPSTGNFITDIITTFKS